MSLSLNRDIQQAINGAIASPDYNPPLPELEAEVWNKVLDWKTHKHSNECLEWLGDGLMYAAISVELYRQVPKGTPHMFTRIRGPIVTNQTFALLTNKLNLSGAFIQHGPNPPLPTSKCFADLFEVLPAEVYMRGGFDILRDWVGKVFGPLIAAAVLEYEKQPPSLNKKRKRVDGHDGNLRLTNRKRTDYATTCHSRDTKAQISGVFSKREIISTTILRGIPTSTSNTAKSRRPTNGAPLLAIDPLARKTVERPLIALSELSRNTPREGDHSVHERASRHSKLGARPGYQTPLVPHHAAWEHVLTHTSSSTSSGLGQAVLASPSRYTAAAPCAPACGPGSSRFDPIIIDDEVDELEDSRSASSSTARRHCEVIELLDDDDSEPHLELVENILIKVAPTQA